jgi:hypothetical protein
MQKLIAILITCNLYACSSNNTNLKAQAQKEAIYMSTKPAPEKCELRGTIYGPQETFSSNSNFKLGKNISQAHINQARELGANYIQMTKLETKGKAYFCPDEVLIDLISA